MALIVDAGPLVALADLDDPHHRGVQRALEASNEPLVVSPFVLAEADYLIARLIGQDAEVRMLSDVVRGSFLLEQIDPSDIAVCIELITRYRDLDIGLADAANIVLAHRYKTLRIATLDERHFRALRSLSGEQFILVPADESQGKKRS